MNEREMGRALLNFDASLAGPAGPGADTGAEARQRMERVLARDRRRVRWLAALTMAAWAATVTLVAGVILGGRVFVYPKFRAIFQDAGGMRAQTPQQVQTVMTYVVAMGTTAVAAAVGVLAVSALCTILLLFASRRATLRQVNASLLVISEQLKEMRAGAEAALRPR